VGVAEAQLGDPEGLTRVDLDGDIFLIAASSLSVGAERQVRPRINDGLVRVRYTPEGDLVAEAMHGFRAWLLAHEPSLAVLGEREPDAGGLNIEGLAWNRRTSALSFGLRGPASPGRIAVVQVTVDAGRAPWTTASLKAPAIVSVRIPDANATPGIRDISYDDDTGDFLILLGRSSSRGNEPFQLATWNGTSAQVRPLDVRFHRSMKPEGVTAISTAGTRAILIVDDRGGYAVLDRADQEKNSLDPPES
jgi:hypothetical protein